MSEHNRPPLRLAPEPTVRVFVTFELDVPVVEVIGDDLRLTPEEFEAKVSNAVQDYPDQFLRHAVDLPQVEVSSGTDD